MTRRSSTRLTIALAMAVALAATTLLQPDVVQANPFKRALDNIRDATASKEAREEREQAERDAAAREQVAGLNVMGVWTGPVEHRSGTQQAVILNMTNPATGAWVYPTNGCTGTLALNETGGFDMTVMQGECDPGGGVKLSMLADGRLLWDAYDAADALTTSMILARQGVTVHPMAAPTRVRRTGSADAATTVMPAGGVPAMITKGANMRQAPSTTAPVVVVIPAGTTILVAERIGDWYPVNAVVGDKPFVGFVYHELIQIDPAIAAALVAATGVAGPSPGSLEISHAGYSERFLTTRKQFVDGELQAIATGYDEEEAELRAKTKNERKLAQRIGVLRWLERGSLALDGGAYGTALTHFSTSEELVEKDRNTGLVPSFFDRTAKGTAGIITGKGELHKYTASGWEKILMLNYKSITYLLQGDRRAYNVTRRAIDWQNMEKKAFDQALLDEEAKLARKNEREAEKLAKKKGTATTTDEDVAADEAESEAAEAAVAAEAAESAPAAPQGPPTADNIAEALAVVFQPLEKKADSVPSAFVNPFGFYVSGMVQEFEGYQDRSLRDNARISYEKALELNPSSIVLQEAADDLKNLSPNRDVNLLHVIVADGWAPEKKVVTYQVPTETGAPLPLKLPVYEPVDNPVTRIEVHSMDGRKIGTLSNVADIEALCLRQQQDMRKILTMRAIGSYLVGAQLEGTARASTGIFGMALGELSKARQSTSAPDTRSWLSLPGTIQATRLQMRKGVDQIRIVSFDANGKRLARTTLDINPDSYGVAYVRSIGTTMYPQVADQLWMASR